jgi:4-amino-4-deoxy-L-arabinose transferase-like glycosyltransferase
VTNADPTPFWARPTFVVAAIVSYLAIFFVVRMTMWPTLGIDDSEQALFAQEFSWSYRNSAPPLFTWLLVGTGKLLGINIVTISVIRYALLGVIYVFAYATARRLIRDPRLSALSVFSFGSIYLFAFYSHHDLTHTTIMAAMLAVSWYAFTRLAETPSLGWYALLGLVFGFGLLGKWNFVMFAAALPLACVVRRDYRDLVLTWKIVATLGVCALIVSPTVMAVLFRGTEDIDTLGSVLVGSDAAYLGRAVEGLGRLIASLFVYPQPLLVLVLVVFALPLWRGLRTVGAQPSALRRPDAEFLLLTIGISILLHIALVFAFGARQFSERLMQPPLFILPIVLFMLIERGRPSPRAINVCAALLAALVAGTLAAWIVVYRLGADHCGSCRNMAPFRALADDLRSAGFSGTGTIVADGFHTGGNMRVEFPKARVLDPAFPPATWPAARDQGPCLLLWRLRDAGPSERENSYLQGYLEERLHASPDAPHRNGVVSGLMFGSKTRQYRMAFQLYDAPAGDCR